MRSQVGGADSRQHGQYFGDGGFVQRGRVGDRAGERVDLGCGSGEVRSGCEQHAGTPLASRRCSQARADGATTDGTARTRSSASHGVACRAPVGTSTSGRPRTVAASGPNRRVGGVALRCVERGAGGGQRACRAAADRQAVQAHPDRRDRVHGRLQRPERDVAGPPACDGDRVQHCRRAPTHSTSTRSPSAAASSLRSSRSSASARRNSRAARGRGRAPRPLTRRSSRVRVRARACSRRRGRRRREAGPGIRAGRVGRGTGGVDERTRAPRLPRRSSSSPARPLRSASATARSARRAPYAAACARRSVAPSVAR